MSSPEKSLDSSPWSAGTVRRYHVEVIGTMRHDGGAPMRRDTIFWIASTSKPVTMAAGDSLARRVQAEAG
ncbi:beta-lactamase family protein [Brevibacterium sp. PAMC21349]|nr:beta-lactamase family protein [Brevibacterium sp. PAMC21349]